MGLLYHFSSIIEEAMAEHIPSYTRADHIDELRGLAVIGMVVVHAIYFFHNGENTTIVSLARLLNTTLLTFFVFIAGLAASRSLDSTAHIPTHHLLWPTAKRIGILYVAYIVIAFVAITSQAVSLSISEIAQKLLAAATLTSPPSFTEFLPLFILLTALSLPMRAVYRSSRKSLSMTIGMSVCLYTLGFALYLLVVPSYLVGIKALIAGHASLLRFPLLFYLPIYIIGLWWQHQSDHNTSQIYRRQKISILLAAVLFIFFGISLNQSHLIPLLDPLTRWPPSIGFLATGLLWSICLYMLQPLFSRIKKITGYMGRDALDMLIHHLLLLFLYRAVFGFQFGMVIQVLVASIALLIITTLLSSLSFTNKITLRGIQTHHPTRLRKRYILLVVLMGALIVWNMSLPKSVSPYGNILNKKLFTPSITLPPTATIYISTNRKWYTKRLTKTNQIELSAQVIDTANGKPVTVSPNAFTIYLEGNVLPISGFAQNNGVVVFIISTEHLSIGTHSLSATIKHSTSSQAKSNNVTIHVTEPLFVAWTFDWEGWAPTQDAISQIEKFGQTYAPIPFTHFVHPRMFMPNIDTAAQKVEMQNFLKTRKALGDEIALHMHMQFDFVAAAGVTPKRSNPWGLRTNEGYDIPTTEYSPSEFRTILDFATNTLAAAGFGDIQGFRAGGWYINEQQLAAVKDAGFTFDSSGRSKPPTGAFLNTPWNLPSDAQPYTINPSDQNTSTTDVGLLEIPNNGLTTYELSATELLTLAKNAYTDGLLTQPKTLIYVSHPQFYSREFVKIPTVLDYLNSVSLERDAGPVVFSTMGDIAKLWNSPNF